VLDVRLRHLVAAAEAEAFGYGGPAMVSRATGLSRRGIRIGAEELKEKLVNPLTRGDPILLCVGHAKAFVGWLMS
jgi:hypothetical protein